MAEQKNYALVTGASSGIGLAFSGELASLGYPLLMVSNEEERLNQAAVELASRFSVKTVPLYMDLARADSAKDLFHFCETNGINVEILINNAGIFFFKDIVDTTPGLLETTLYLHIITSAMLCRLFAEKAIREGIKSYIINISSIAAWMMMPGITLYSSTKSFIRGFSRAMRHETLKRGVSITTICPGAVATGLYKLPEKYLKLGVRLGIILPPERLARLSLKKMYRHKAEFIPGGLLNRLFILLIIALPDWLVRLIKKKIDRKFNKTVAPGETA